MDSGSSGSGSAASHSPFGPCVPGELPPLGTDVEHVPNSRSRTPRAPVRWTKDFPHRFGCRHLARMSLALGSSRIVHLQLVHLQTLHMQLHKVKESEVCWFLAGGIVLHKPAHIAFVLDHFAERFAPFGGPKIHGVVLQIFVLQRLDAFQTDLIFHVGGDLLESLGEVSESRSDWIEP